MDALTWTFHSVTTVRTAGCPGTGFGSLDGKFVVGLLSFLGPGLLAWWQWSRTRGDRRRALRSSYLAQLHSLSDVVDREISFIDEQLMPYTWFPILPYLREGDGALAAAGLLPADEVRSVLEADFVYRERTTYIAKYGTLVLGEGGLASAIGVNISSDEGSRMAIYRVDVEKIGLAVKPALERLQLASEKDARKLWKP